MPVFLVENITREALMILKENKVMVALIKNVFDEKYAKLLAEIVSVFSHSSAIISTISISVTVTWKSES